MAGFVPLWRDYLDHEVFQDADLWRLFSWCLMSANFRQSKYLGTQLEPGQFVIGRISSSQVLGVPPATFERRLKKLENMGLISRKSSSQFTIVTIADGRVFANMENPCDTTVDTTDDTASDTANGHPVIQPVIQQMGTEEEGNKGTMEQGNTISAATQNPKKPAPEKPVDSSPIVLTFPVSGRPFTWNLTERLVAVWSDAYPQVDIVAEAKKALVWVNANNKKTAKGMERFLVSWFGRANDRRPSANGHANRGFEGNPSDPRGNFAAREEFLARHAERVGT